MVLQSFAVPTFAGEVEVAEVIDDGAVIEEDSYVEDEDLVVVDDTAETFDEVAVDVAEGGDEFEDQFVEFDGVEEPVEEVAGVNAAVQGESTGTFTGVQFNATRNINHEWDITASFTFDGDVYDVPLENNEYTADTVKHKHVASVGNGLSITWNDIDVSKIAENSMAYRTFDATISATDANNKPCYVNYKNVRLTQAALSGSYGTAGNATDCNFTNVADPITIYRQANAENCIQAQVMGHYFVWLADDVTFENSYSVNNLNTQTARMNVPFPAAKDILGISRGVNEPGISATGIHAFGSTALDNYTSDAYVLNIINNMAAVNTKEVNGSVELVNKANAGLYVEKLTKQCTFCHKYFKEDGTMNGVDGSSPVYRQVLVLPEHTMSQDPYVQVPVSNSDGAYVLGLVDKKTLKNYITSAEFNLGKNISTSSTPIYAKYSVEEFKNFDVILSDCTKKSYYTVVTPKVDVTWNSDYTGSEYTNSGLKIVQGGKVLSYTSYADWKTDTDNKYEIAAPHHITLTFAEATNAADDVYLKLNGDGTVTNLNCAKTIDYTIAEYCIYDNATTGTGVYFANSVNGRDYSTFVDAAANRKWKELSRTKKATAPKGTTHSVDETLEKALTTSVMTPVQDSTNSIVRYTLTYRDTVASKIYTYVFTVQDATKGIYSVVRTSTYLDGTSDGSSNVTTVVTFANNTSTCEKDGTVDVTLKCLVCNEDAKTVTANVAKHIAKVPATYTKEVVTPATCTKEGVDAQVKKCEICGTELERKEVPSEKLDHDFKDQEIQLAVTTGNVIIWDGIKANQIYDLYNNQGGTGNFGNKWFGDQAEEYKIHVELYKVCKNCNEEKSYWNTTHEALDGRIIPAFAETSMKGTFKVTSVTPQNELGDNGKISFTVTYNYTNKDGELVTLEKVVTDHPYYTDFTSYLDRKANANAKALIANVDELPDVDKLTLDDAKAVEDAVAAYKALDPNQRELVDDATEGKLAKAQAKIEELVAAQKETVKKNMDEAVKAAAAAAAGSEAQKTALENLEKAIATAKVAGLDTTAAEKTLKDQQAVYDKAAAAIAAAEKAAAAAQANPTAENIKAAEDAIAAAKAAGASDADLKKAADAKAAADTAKKAADDKKVTDAVNAANTASQKAANSGADADITAAKNAIDAAKKAGATDAQLTTANANLKKAEEKKAANAAKNATITVNKAKVKKGKKATVTVKTDSKTKITITAKNKKAKNKKSVKINGSKIKFTKKAKAGTYKFTVKTEAGTGYKATTKVIKVKVTKK